ncbi:hypothetical protein HPB48_026327 [Haemaphysalis longicornis]|uniref:Alpha 1,4-glycosyltransferase domain-containing protein n=1 Tax=Haemaphysalis longicornis TaxID=44386 RepID=A0A9J6H9C2_HAELO|nr:hypothetical protein HPB48_026327 [Haemaphysalis longicornis]
MFTSHITTVQYYYEVISDGKDQIWFLETSYRNTLTAREACSIESACKHNPNHTVHLLSTGNIQNAGCPYHNILSSIGNLKSLSIEVNAVLEETPLGKLYKSGAVKSHPYAVSHLSDFLRYAVLWYKGGIYLDTDVIVMRSLGGLRNSAVYEEDGSVVASSVLFFDAGHHIMWAAMDKCARGYKATRWTTCGPDVMSFVHENNTLGRTITFLKSTTFVAVKYWLWQHLFLPVRLAWVLETTNGSYGVHFWNKLSKEQHVVPGSHCAMDVLAKEHCPRVYKLASSYQYF